MEELIGPSRELVEYVAEIGEGFDAIELAGLDQCIEGRRPLATSVVTAYSAQIGHPVQLKPATQSTGIRPPEAERRRGWLMFTPTGSLASILA